MTSPDIARGSSYIDRLSALRPAIRDRLASPLPAALGYLAAVTVSELVTTLVDPRLGLILHGTTLFAMLIHAAITSNRRLQRLIFSLTLAPLIRLVSLSLPLVNFPFAYWYMIVGAPLMLAAFVAARVVGVNRRMAGVVLGRHWFLQMLIGLSGLGLGYLEYLILRPDPLIQEFDWLQMLVPALVLMVFTGFLEEYIFRGVMQHTAIRSLGTFGLIFVSILFAALHIGYKSILDLVFVFVVAVYFSLASQKTRSLLGVTVAHGLTNIGLFLIFPFIVAAPRPVLSQPTSVPPVIQLPAGSLQETAVPATATPGQISGPALWGAPPTHTPGPTVTALPTRTALPSATPSPTPTITPTVTPNVCAPPENWVAYTVKAGDNLALFRQLFHIKKSDLLAANCNPALEEVVVGQVFYLPYIPPTPVPTIKLQPSAVPVKPPGERPQPEPPASRP